jgi:hypothetical protein
MPGTTLRAPSCLTNVFQAAIIIRGNDVEMTVSSMSLTRPVVTSGPTMKTSDSTSWAPLRGELHPVPPRFETVVSERRVDVAGAVAAAVEGPVADRHGDRDAHRRGRDERPPAAVAQEWRTEAAVRGIGFVAAGALLARPPEQDAGEHPEERRRPVAHVADDPVLPATAAQPTLELPMPRVLDDG